VYGLRVLGERDRRVLDEAAERSLRAAAIWDETKGPADPLRPRPVRRAAAAAVHRPGAGDRAGDLLFDEPTSALDPQSTSRIETLIGELNKRVTIMIVTHNMQQAARVSDYTAVMYLGNLVEFDVTSTIFTKPSHKITEQYVTAGSGDAMARRRSGSRRSSGCPRAAVLRCRGIPAFRREAGPWRI
jgi:phosphate transport system ATP-binding protein